MTPEAVCREGTSRKYIKKKTKQQKNPPKTLKDQQPPCKTKLNTHTKKSKHQTEPKPKSLPKPTKSNPTKHPNVAV